MAIGHVAKEQNLAETSLQDILKKGRRDAPAEYVNMWPTLADAKAFVARRAAAQARLDRIKARAKKPKKP